MEFTVETAAQVLKKQSKSQLGENGIVLVKSGSMIGKSACAAYDYLKYKAPNHPLVFLTN